MAQAAARVEAAVEPEREVPEIEPRDVVVNVEGFVSRDVTVRCPKDMVSDDLRDPKVWRRVQLDHQKSLRKFDTLRIVGFDESWMARATVVEAKASEARLCIESVKTFRDPDQTLWNDGTLEVRWTGSGYTVHRMLDGVQVVPVGFGTEAQAVAAALRSYPKVV